MKRSKSKMQGLRKLLQERTGLSRKYADAIIDAILRERDLSALALQKGLPIQENIIAGPTGTITVMEVRCEYSS